MARGLATFQFSDCVISDFLKYYVFFLLGVYVAEYAIEKLKNHLTIALTLCGFILLVGNIEKYFYGFHFYRVLTFILAIAGSVFVIALSIVIKEERVLECLGKKSLPIYVLQGIAIAASRLMVTRLHMNTIYGVVPLIVCTFMGCVMPLCAYWLSKKIWKLDGCFYPGRYIKLGE